MIKLPVGRGFLPNYNPLRKLPFGYEMLSDIASNLPEYYTEGTIRKVVRDLPTLPVNHLSGPEQEAVMRDYAFIVSAYYHTPKYEENPSYIPSNLAVPFYQISQKFGKPPILSYCSYCLNNWWCRFDNRGIDLGNIELIRKFTFTRDEKWFILVHVDIEANAQPLLGAMVHAIEAANIHDDLILEQNLILMGKIVDSLYKTLARMQEECHPEAYYKEVRIPIMQFKNIIFEGVKELGGNPISLLGETGAQSSIIPSLVGAMEINHKQTGMMNFLAAHHQYMPPDHRRFIAEVKKSTIRQRVLQVKKTKLNEAYNFVLDRMYQFRAQHYEWAKLYIFSHVPDKTGTGGTPADIWLAQLRDETAEHIIR